MFSGSNSLNSTNVPDREYSTTLPGIGGRAGKTISGNCLADDARSSDGRGVASRVEDQERKRGLIR